MNKVLLLAAAGFIAMKVMGKVNAASALEVEYDTVMLDTKKTTLSPANIALKLRLIIKNPTNERLAFQAFVGLVSLNGVSMGNVKVGDTSKSNPTQTFFEPKSTTKITITANFNPFKSGSAILNAILANINSKVPLAERSFGKIGISGQLVTSAITVPINTSVDLKVPPDAKGFIDSVQQFFGKK
jgi:hypothetical protein